MLRPSQPLVLIALLACASLPASAEDIDSLRGQFAFDWHTAPDQVTCKAVDDRLLALFKSEAYKCNLEVVSNTASDEPARVCAEIRDDGAEYLIFATKKSCELERETQVSNGP